MKRNLMLVGGKKTMKGRDKKCHNCDGKGYVENKEQTRKAECYYCKGKKWLYRGLWYLLGLLLGMLLMGHLASVYC